MSDANILEPRAVVLQLPWPVSINAYWGTSRFGGVYVKAAGKEYIRRASEQVRRLGEPPLVGRIFFDAKFYPPDRRERDLDNSFKVLIDAVAKSGIIANDKHIKKIHAEMMEPLKLGAVVVELSEIPQLRYLF